MCKPDLILGLPLKDILASMLMHFVLAGLVWTAVFNSPAIAAESFRVDLEIYSDSADFSCGLDINSTFLVAEDEAAKLEGRDVNVGVFLAKDLNGSLDLNVSAECGDTGLQNEFKVHPGEIAEFENAFYRIKISATPLSH